MTEKPSARVTVNLLIRLAIALVVCGTLVYLIWIAIDAWRGLQRPVDAAESVGRAVLGMEQPRSSNTSVSEADARDIAAAVAIDVEGERVTCLGDAQRELIDITLRAKQRLPHLSYRQIVSKALAWVPDNWDYPGWWRDRDTSIVEMSRSETVKELVPVVMQRMQSGPGEGCAAKVVRAQYHWAGFIGGEWMAAKIIRTYPKDPRFDKKKCKTDFRCLPH